MTVTFTTDIQFDYASKFIVLQSTKVSLFDSLFVCSWEQLYFGLTGKKMYEKPLQSTWFGRILEQNVFRQ